MSLVPKERRKAAIQEWIKFANEAKDLNTQVLWLRHIVKGLFDEVFHEAKEMKKE